MQINRTQHNLFIFIVAATTIVFFWIIRDFLQPFFWAVLMAILFQPLYKQFLRLLGQRPSCASLLSVIAIILLVLIPLILTGIAVFQESYSLYQQISSGKIAISAPISFFEQSLPVLTDLLDNIGLNLDKLKQWLSNTAVSASQFIASNLLTLGQDALRFGTMTMIMLYLLYFFLKDGKKIMDIIIRLIPLGNEREKKPAA